MAYSHGRFAFAGSGGATIQPAPKWVSLTEASEAQFDEDSYECEQDDAMAHPRFTARSLRSTSETHNDARMRGRVADYYQCSINLDFQSSKLWTQRSNEAVLGATGLLALAAAERRKDTQECFGLVLFDHLTARLERGKPPQPSKFAVRKNALSSGCPSAIRKRLKNAKTVDR